MAKAKKNPGGRPTKYNAEYHPMLVYYMAHAGMTEIDICKKIGISEKTINNWKNKYPKFLQALKAGKDDPDDKVQSALFQRAVGYSCVEQKVVVEMGQSVVVDINKQYPPDPTSMIFWLKNRRPNEWRDKKEVDGSMTINIIDDID